MSQFTGVITLVATADKFAPSTPDLDGLDIVQAVFKIKQVVTAGQRLIRYYQGITDIVMNHAEEISLPVKIQHVADEKHNTLIMSITGEKAVVQAFMERISRGLTEDWKPGKEN